MKLNKVTQVYAVLSHGYFSGWQNWRADCALWSWSQWNAYVFKSRSSL